MEQQIIFLDVDGTLCDEFGALPQSAVDAVHQAQANGHLVYLCTGRALAELYDYILDIGFDGIIGSAGGYIQVGKDVIFERHFTKSEIESIVQFFNANQIPFYLEANSGIYASQSCVTSFHNFIKRMCAKKPDQAANIQQTFGNYVNSMIDYQKSNFLDINKITFLDNSYGFDEIKQHFPEYILIPNTVADYGKNGGELALKGISKGFAITKVIEHLNFDIANTFGYGDSYNDHEMIEVVKHGIAMGNATQSLKDIADDVTDNASQDGLYNSFKKYHLI